MKKDQIFSIIMILVTLSSIGNSSIAKIDHEVPIDDCSDVKVYRAISTTEDTIAYNTTEIKVPKNTCVQLTFVNLQTIEHDFVINADPDHNFNMVHMHLANNTAGHMGSNFIKMNITTPNVDITYKFYCSIAGHNKTMIGDFIVGSGAPPPSFELLTGVFVVAIVIIGIVIYAVKRR